MGGIDCKLALTARKPGQVKKGRCKNWVKEMAKEMEEAGLKTSDATNRELWRKKTKYCLKELSILGGEINCENDAEININADQDSNE